MGTLEQILGQQLPPVLKPSLLAEPADPVVVNIARNMEIYFMNPWQMITDQTIWTMDEVDMLNPVKQFPAEPWLQHVTQTWLDVKLLALYKSRRMLITWLMCFLHLWLAMFREGANIFLVSDKEEKSDKLVKRCGFIYNHIPDDMILKPQAKLRYCHLEFPGLNSRIQGVPQGADQLRQEGATAILADEVAFWDNAREMYMASKPTIDGGGKFTCISSPQVGFM